MGRIAVLTIVIVLSCGVYDPPARFTIEDVAGTWLQRDSSSYPIDSIKRVGVPLIDSTHYLISPDSFIVSMKKHLLNQSFSTVWRGSVQAESTYTDMGERQVVLVRFYDTKFPDSLFNILYRIDRVVIDSLFLSVINHDPRLGSYPEVTRYNESARVVRTSKLVRL